MYLAPLNYDRFFNKVFSDKEIAREFLQDFLNVEIQSIELLEKRHKVTDDAAIVEFDFRCKIDENYVIIDMQQWYKPDVIQRFFVYHAVSTSLQLEHLETKEIILKHHQPKVTKVKDYRKIQPVLTLIWMADDSLRFTDDFVSYSMTPEVALQFIQNHKLRKNKKIEEIIEAREKILKILKNDTKDLDFLPKNRLIFIFQKNIIRNMKNRKQIPRYEKWFEFAEKTRNTENTKEDFRKFANDTVFSKIIKRLDRTTLTTSDMTYIDTEKENWEGFTKLQQDIFDMGEKQGVKEGRKEEAVEIAQKMKQNGLPAETISQCTGLAIEEIEKI